MVLAGLLVLCTESSRAGTARFKVDPPWTTQKGLPESSVFSLLQTRDGYLWVGTGYGLARFDGIHFRTFNETEAPGLTSGIIVKLFEDSRGNLWIGTEKAGIWVVDKGGKITGLTKLGKGPNARLVTIVEDPSGSIWFSTATHGLFQYRDGTLESRGNDCNGLAVDNAGLMWVGIRDNQTRTEKLIGLGPISSKPVPALQLAHELPIGTLDYLLASRMGGYWRLADGLVQKWEKDQMVRNFGPYPWQHTPVNAACEDKAGNLIVGTYGDGIYWLNTEGKFDHLEELPSSYIYSLCTDREGSLWVGTDARGLNRVRRPIFDTLESGLAITSVSADRVGGLWVGINNGGVNYYQEGKMPRKFAAKQGLAGLDLYVRSVLADREGRVWVGTISGGLFELKGDSFKQVENWLAVSTGVSVLHEDRQGLVWVGTEEGLICREPRKFYTIQDGLSSNAIQALADDPAGNFWIGTQSGLNVLRSGRFTSFHTTNGLPAEDVRSLYVDKDDVLWVGTSSGLARFDGTNWTRYPKETGLPSNPIGYLAEDAEHFLWLGTMAGLVRVNKTDLNAFAHGSIRTVASRIYGVEDGLPDSQCFAGPSQPAAAVSKGKLWFPTIQGLVSVRPEQIVPNTNRPPVRIEEIRVEGILQNTFRIRSAPPSAVTIQPGQEGLEINYASLNLAAPERARFRHRLALLGHDAIWKEAGNVRVIQYPALPPGEYRFEVTACNEDGIWNETPSSLAVTVLPPFWRTGWFITVLSFSILGLVVSLVHYASTQRLQRQVGLLRQQEALEKERARIARDLHDQLGANLTQVALLGEMVETDKEVPDEVESHARQISATARDTTRALDEIVWTVNPSNDTLDGLINYVCKYAQEYLALAGLRYRLEVPSQLPSIPISPELRHNVFLAAKEAVNNVVKHAKATSAWLRLRLDGEQFILEIEDDGRGLVKGDEKKGRSGLVNMRKRMEDISGKFEAIPGQQSGTIIRLVAPLRKPAPASEEPVT